MMKIYSICVCGTDTHVLDFDEVRVALRDLNIYKKYIDFIYESKKIKLYVEIV